MISFLNSHYSCLTLNLKGENPMFPEVLCAYRIPPQTNRPKPKSTAYTLERITTLHFLPLLLSAGVRVEIK